MFFLPTLLGAVSTGLDFLGQRRAATAQASAADFNASVQKVNAEFDLKSELEALKVERMIAETQYSEAQLNYTMASTEAQARLENADRLKQFASARTAEGRESIRRRRRDFAKFQGTQRARVGASGVTEQGSPLETFAETAGQIELALNEMQRDANSERRETLNQAEYEARDGRLGQVTARAGLDAAGNALNVSRITSGMNEASAGYRYQSALTATQFGLSASNDQVSGARLGSLGTLISGAATWGANRKNSKYLGAFK